MGHERARLLGAVGVRVEFVFELMQRAGERKIYGGTFTMLRLVEVVDAA